MGCLYKIEFSNGKGYIGISNTTAKDRWQRHARGKNPTMLIGRAFKKYGEDSARLSIMVVANDWNYLCDLERRAIVVFKTKHPLGYNMTDGGDGMLGHEWSAEARAKVSAFHKGRKKSATERAAISARQKGVPKNWTDEWKENIKKALRGKTWSLGLKHSQAAKDSIAAITRARWADPEERLKILESRKGKQKQHPMKGRKHSDKSKAKMSAAHKGVRLSEKHKAALTAARQAPKVIAAQREKMLGKTASKTTRRKMSASAKLAWRKRKCGF